MENHSAHPSVSFCQGFDDAGEGGFTRSFHFRKPGLDGAATVIARRPDGDAIFTDDGTPATGDSLLGLFIQPSLSAGVTFALTSFAANQILFFQTIQNKLHFAVSLALVAKSNLTSEEPVHRPACHQSH